MSAVKLRPLEDHILTYFEKVIEMFQYCVILLSSSLVNVRGGQDIFSLFAEAVQQHRDLLYFGLLGGS